jgi:predicted nucleic acid-binding protein
VTRPAGINQHTLQVLAWLFRLARLRREHLFRAKGAATRRLIGANDLWIGCTARTVGLPLATGTGRPAPCKIGGVV